MKVFRRRKSLHIGTNFGNNSDGSEITADTRSGLKNGKFLLIGSGECKNEFFKLCFPGFKVFIMSFDYFELTSLFRSDISVNGKTLKNIMWCEDEAIKPYFIKAGKNLTYGDLKRQLSDSLEDKPFPELSEALQRNTFWEFGSKEEHFKYRNAVMQAYPYGNFPVFDGFNHMQYQIRDPKGFAEMLEKIIETGKI